MTTEVFAYQKEDGTVPLVDWIDGLPEKAQVKCIEKIELLEAFGNQLRRPHAAPLRDGIHELRFRYLRVRYRVLYFFYFFHGKSASVLSHGTSKTDKVPENQIDLAIRRRLQVTENPKLLTHL